MPLSILPKMAIGLFLTLCCIDLSAQERYKYYVDLNESGNDRLKVSLECPTVTSATTKFFLPRIVPGTYMNSNFGKYVQNLKAFSKDGKTLSTKKLDDNSWEISRANELAKITYEVDDTWDAKIDNQVYEMVGTNFEAGKNFVINTCGVFGYLEGMKKTPFELNFTKPEGFYGATGLKHSINTATTEQFLSKNADELYDSPIMYSRPDTTSMDVAGARVLIAVYSPNKKATSAFIARNFEPLMKGTKDYLKGKLPVDQYAFIFYFNGEQAPFQASGAWEHSYSSFYALPEQEQETGIHGWVDIAAHEFFHIVSPLTISSNLVKEFEFNETRLSKHLWLYEGSTEYYAHHMQVWTGLITPEKFIEALAEKINYSRLYFNDTLSFAELSTESAGKWHEQFVNVYLKGALISACLDLELLKLSDGQYGLRDLKHDLGVRYGKDRYFLEDELFDEIEKLSYPDIKSFLLQYVDGNTPIPYEKYFAYAGVKYYPEKVLQTINLGGISIRPDKADRLVIDTKNMNDFGKKVGYKDGDWLISINGNPVNSGNMTESLERYVDLTKEGDPLTVVVMRDNGKKKRTQVTLNATVEKSDKKSYHILEFDANATPEQLRLRRIWLNQDCK